MDAGQRRAQGARAWRARARDRGRRTGSRRRRSRPPSRAGPRPPAPRSPRRAARPGPSQSSRSGSGRSASAGSAAGRRAAASSAAGRAYRAACSARRESRGGEQRRPRAAPREQRVRGDRAAVDDALGLPQAAPRSASPCVVRHLRQAAPARRRRGPRGSDGDFEQAQTPSGVVGDHVDERAARYRRRCAAAGPTPSVRT